MEQLITVILGIFVAVVLIALIFSGEAVILQCAYNFLAGSLFTGPDVTFLQALAIVVILNMIAGLLTMGGRK
jgi:hypothetical protein